VERAVGTQHVPKQVRVTLTIKTYKLTGVAPAWVVRRGVFFVCHPRIIRRTFPTEGAQAAGQGGLDFFKP
jgi:hypothetical protein